MKKGLVLGLGILAFLVLLVWLTVGGSRKRVRVCVEFQGRTECRAASGETREEAERTAVQNVCTTLAQGMTESMACQRAPRQTSELAGGR
jgi:hypothetical protein